MPYTSAQQSKLDAAQKRNDAAKNAWATQVEFWNKNFVSIPCYTDTKYDAVAAATWFTPNDSSCSQGKGCTHKQKVDCKDAINTVLNNIKYIRSAYTELGNAQKNYDTVFAEVTAEVQNDPDFISHQNEIIANAAANKLKWIFWISVVVVVAIAAFVYFKWFKK